MRLPLAILATAFSFWATVSIAQTVPERAELRVNDYADLLDTEAEGRITRKLNELATEFGTDITVLTIGSRSDHSDAPNIESFATALFNTWGIGSAANNSGILILVAREDREMRIELGASYPPIYNDISENVIDGAFLPAFRNDDYQTGIETGVSRTIDRIAVPFAKGEEVRAEPEGGLTGTMVGLLAVGGMGVLGLGGTLIYRARRKCPRCGQQTLDRSKKILKSSSRTSSGRGEAHANCRNCDFSKVTLYTIPMISSSDSSFGGSSGSSSGGGGSSSGGGGSGSW